jgi:hypothetical protein
VSRNTSTYVDLDGHEWNLKELDAQERRLFTDLRRFAEACRFGETGSDLQRWCDFDNYRLPKILAIYEPRGFTRKQITRSALFQLSEDLSGRLGIALGLARNPNYRDSIQRIVTDQFKSRRAFCEATGLSEDMLSHVLAGRKDLSIGTLTKALDRIGYMIQFVPRDPQAKPSA